jgi:hypothetical protein
MPLAIPPSAGYATRRKDMRKNVVSRINTDIELIFFRLSILYYERKIIGDSAKFDQGGDEGAD